MENNERINQSHTNVQQSNNTPSSVNTSIDWDKDSTKNPLLWPRGKKWTIAAIISFTGFLSTCGSSAFVAASEPFQQEFHVSRQVSNLSTTLYVLGLGSGPFLFSPMSEIYGRQPVYTISMIGFTLFGLGVGFCKSFESLLILRFIAGVFGSSGPSLGVATITDMFEPAERGKPVAMYAVGPMAGPVFGTMLGFWLVLASWRWIAWAFTIANALNTVAVIVLMQETFHAVIKRKLLQEQLGKNNNDIINDNHTFISKLKLKYKSFTDLTTEAPTVFSRAFTRPPRLLFGNPVCALFSFYWAYLYSIIYMFLVSMPLLFAKQASASSDLFTYSWPKQTAGLAYLSLGVGFFASAAVASSFQDRIYRYFTLKNGQGRPEYRLVLTQGGSLILPIGLLIWGWTAEIQAPFIVPMIGIAIFSFGIMQGFNSIQNYLIDAFAPYSASAMAVAVFMRSLLGCILPLFSDELFKHLGWGLGGTLLALISIPAIPAPAVMWFFGKSLRERFKFRP